MFSLRNVGNIREGEVRHKIFQRIIVSVTFICNSCSTYDTTQNQFVIHLKKKKKKTTKWAGSAIRFNFLFGLCDITTRLIGESSRKALPFFFIWPDDVCQEGKRGTGWPCPPLKKMRFGCSELCNVVDPAVGSMWHVDVLMKMVSYVLVEFTHSLSGYGTTEGVDPEILLIDGICYDSWHCRYGLTRGIEFMQWYKPTPPYW